MKFRLISSALVVALCAGCPMNVGGDDGGTGGGTTGGGTTGGGTTGGGDPTGGGTTGGGTTGGGTTGGGTTGGGTTGGGGGTTGGGTGGGTTGGGTGGGTTGGGTGGGTTTGDGGVALTAFCDGWAQAYCDREARCLFLDPAQNATCLARVKADCDFWQRRVTAGVFAYDTNVGAACIAASEAFTCATGRGFFGAQLNFGFGQGPAECDPLLTGAGTAGTPCTQGADCAAGYTCPAAGTSCRTCVAQPSVGSACNNGGNPCYQAWCGPAGDGGNQCFSYLAVDAVCSGQGQCDPTTTRACSPLPTDGGMRRCLAKDVDGALCTVSNTCQSGYCNQGNRTDAGVRTCGYIATGSPCGSVNDCGPTAWCNGVTINTPGLCTARTATGGTCTVQSPRTDQNDGCELPDICLDGTCKARDNMQAAGMQCRSTITDCVMGTYCPTQPNDGGISVCTAQLMAGAPCQASSECGAGMRCNANVCLVLGSAGGACTATQNCKAALTCPQIDAGTGTFSCTPLASPGTACTNAGPTCASGMDNGQAGFCQIDAGTTSGACSALLAVGVDCGNGGQCASGRCLQADGGALAGPMRGVCFPPCVP